MARNRAAELLAALAVHAPMPKIHSHPPKSHPSPHAPSAHPPKVSEAAKGEGSKHAEAPKLGPKAMRDTFRDLDRNHDRYLDRRELLSVNASLTGKLKGDRDGDSKLSFTEYTQALKEGPHKGASTNHGHAKPPEVRTVHEAFAIKDHLATFRTHPRGLTRGLLQPGDTFIASASQGPWVFGYVKGHPERMGWVLRTSLPAKHHTPTAEERAAGPQPVHMQKGLEYYTSNDMQVMKFFQDGDDIPESQQLGYTTLVSPKDSTKQVDVYANSPCTPGNKLEMNGHALKIPAGEQVKFRYMPDGESAVVYLSAELLDKMGVDRKKLDGKRPGIWAIVKSSDLDIPPGTMGVQTPARRMTHVAA